jgi:hypothetical protein
MSSDTCSSSATKVDSNVKSVRIVGVTQDCLTSLGEIHKLVRCFLWQLVKLARMKVWNDQQMTADVGIDI